MLAKIGEFQNYKERVINLVGHGARKFKE